MEQANQDPTDVPQTPEKEKSSAGRKSLIQNYLEKNASFKNALIEGKEKIAVNPDLVSQPIENLEDLFLYMQFELERSRNTDLLRGKTLTEYSKEFVNVFKAIEQSKLTEAELKIKIEVARRNRTEVEEFMKFAIVAITAKVTDLNLRKEISQEIKNLYDKKYSTKPAEPNTTDTPGDSTTALST